MAKRSAFIILLVFVFCVCSYAADSSSTIELKASNEIGDVRAIEAALKEAEGQQRTLLIPAGKWAISENLNIISCHI